MTTEVIDETQAQLEQAAQLTPEEKPVCTHCDMIAVCLAGEPNGGGVVPLCHEHAGIARAEGRDLFVLGSNNVPFEFVPSAPKVYVDPEDAEPEPPIDPNSEEALAEYDRETRELIDKQALEVSDTKIRYEGAKEIASARKKAMELAQEDLLALIQRRADERGKPKQPTLFKDPPAETNAETEVDAKAPEPEPDTTGVWQGNHEFTPQELATPLSSLSIAQGVLNALNEGRKKDGSSFTPITTVGQYFEYCKPLANGWVPNLRDIKGIGDGKADAIEKAILDFTEECCNAKRKAA